MLCGIGMNVAGEHLLSEPRKSIEGVIYTGIYNMNDMVCSCFDDKLNNTWDIVTRQRFLSI